MVAASAVKVGDNAGDELGRGARRSDALHALRSLQMRAPRRCSAKARSTRASCSSASSPATRRIWPGRPFVGPAGQLFDRALAEAGVDRERTYVTNAVKHFKFVRRGKRRIHDKPDGGEIAACRWWLEQELALIRPPLIVALGATAARSLFGKVVTISSLRGQGPCAARGRRGLGHRPPQLPAARPRR